MAKKHKSKSKNSSDEYATPQWVVKKINKGTNGVDLDPCSGADLRPHEGWSETVGRDHRLEPVGFLRPHEGWSETMPKVAVSTSLPGSNRLTTQSTINTPQRCGGRLQSLYEYDFLFPFFGRLKYQPVIRWGACSWRDVFLPPRRTGHTVCNFRGRVGL